MVLCINGMCLNPTENRKKIQNNDLLKFNSSCCYGEFSDLAIA